MEKTKIRSIGRWKLREFNFLNFKICNFISFRFVAKREREREREKEAPQISAIQYKWLQSSVTRRCQASRVKIQVVKASSVITSFLERHAD